MIIRDKQELKRCVKQVVRRTLVVETELDFDVQNGAMGVSALLHTWALPAGAPQEALRRACTSETPFCEGAVTMFAALDALELPAYNLNNAQTIQESYDRNAYLREVLDAMRARRVLVRVPAESAEQVAFDDNRFAPMLSIDGTVFFAPSRYGVDYEERAQELARLLAACNARDLQAVRLEIQPLRYCLVPLSEDMGCTLHLHAANAVEAGEILELMKAHPQARAVIACSPTDERALIDLAQGVSNILVRLSGFENMRYALEKLNTHFIPYSSLAALPEQMLGRWENARETIWQILFDAYLPLARAGYELTSEAIERDAANLLGGNLESLNSNIT